MTKPEPIEWASWFEASERSYELYCGNFECPDRLAGRTSLVPDSQIVDGELWLCVACGGEPVRPPRMIVRHYPINSSRGQWIVGQLAEATSTVCSAPACENRFVPRRKGHECCSTKCETAARRDRKRRRVERDAGREKRRMASTYPEPDSPDKPPKSRADYQDVRDGSGPVIADTADTDRRCANCGRDISHRRRGAVVCGDACRKALARYAARAGEQLALDLASLEEVE